MWSVGDRGRAVWMITSDMEELLSQVGHLLTEVVTNLTNPEAWKNALSDPNVTLAAFIVLNLIVFTETGLLFGRVSAFQPRARRRRLVTHEDDGVEVVVLWNRPPGRGLVHR